MLEEGEGVLQVVDCAEFEAVGLDLTREEKHAVVLANDIGIRSVTIPMYYVLLGIH